MQENTIIVKYILFPTSEMDFETPIRNFLQDKRNRTILWNVLLGFKSKLVKELKDPLVTAMNIEGIVNEHLVNKLRDPKVKQELISSQRYAIEQLTSSSLYSIRETSPARLNEIKNEVANQIAAVRTAYKSVSDNEYAVFESRCKTFIKGALNDQ